MRLQACIHGYSGKPATVLATYAEDGGAVFIAKSVSYRQERVSDSVLIANSELPEMEHHFKEDSLGDAIEAFNRLRNGGLISFDKSVQGLDPTGAIEQDGITETGRKMRISPDIKNDQIAILAICLYAGKARTNAKVMDMMDALMRIQGGSILTI